MGTYAFITSSRVHYYYPRGFFTWGIANSGSTWAIARSGASAFLYDDGNVGANGTVKETGGNYTVSRSFRTLNLDAMAAGGSVNYSVIYGTAICSATENGVISNIVPKPSLVISSSSNGFPLVAGDFTNIGAGIAEYTEGTDFACSIGSETTFAVTTNYDDGDTPPFSIGEYVNPEISASYNTLVPGVATASVIITGKTTATLRGTFTNMGFGGIYVEYDGDPPTGFNYSYCEYKLHSDPWFYASSTSPILGQLLGTTLSWTVSGLSPNTLYDVRFTCQGGIVSNIVTFRTGINSGNLGGLLGILLAFGYPALDSNPVWTDVTTDVISIKTKRGRTHELDKVEAGLATILLRNFDGKYWPDNSAGAPYQGNILPLVQVAIRPRIDSDTYYLWQGHVESWNPKWLSDRGGKLPVMEIQCVGCFKALSRCVVNSVAGADIYSGALSGVAIYGTLLAAQWPIALENLDGGVLYVQDAGDLTNVSALTQCHKLEEAESGLLFEDGRGRVSFFDQIHSVGQSIVATFSDSDSDIAGGACPYILPEFSYDDQYIFNDIHVTVQGTGALDQNVYDTTSIALYGLRSMARSGSLLLDDPAASDQALYLLKKYCSPTVRLKSLTVLPDGDPNKLYPIVWGLEIADKVHVNVTTQTGIGTSLNQDYFVDGIEHEYDARQGIWTTKFQLRIKDFWVIPPTAGTKTSFMFCLGAVGGAYATTHNNPIATYVANDIDEVSAGATYTTKFGPASYAVDRGILKVDTSSVSSGDTITSAQVSMYVTADHLAFPAGWECDLVNSTYLSYPAVVGDYGGMLYDTTVLGSLTYADLGSIAGSGVAGWVLIDLNASGIAHINKGGDTLFGIRTKKDIDNDTPVDENDLVHFGGSNSAYPPSVQIKVA